MTAIIKKYKAVTPGLRNKIVIKDSDLHKGGPYKYLIKGKSKTGGRNSNGRITIRFRGGSMTHRKLLRKIELIGPYSKLQVIRLEYDPNRSAFIALCKNLNNNKYKYILAHENIKIGDYLEGYNLINERKIFEGNTLVLNKIPLGTSLFNLEIQSGKGSKLVKAAGTSSILIKKNPTNSLIQLPSKKLKLIDNNCLATIGSVINKSHHLKVLGKAGINRILGKRPRVQGVAMNPIDHPHGGKTPVSGGRGGKPKTKWGKLAKWTPKRISKFA